MIARIRGTLAAKSPGEIIVDVGGVGYQVFVSLTTFYELCAVGAEVSLDIFTHVREDTLQLYGFLDRNEKRVFELLLGVAGIGPRLATNVLSGIPAHEMVDALVEGNVTRLMAIPGVGRKLAERLTVELKDRAALLGGDRVGPAGGDRDGRNGRAGAGLLREATSALVNLGYRPAQAERAVKNAAATAGDRLEDVIRVALRTLAE